MRSGRGGQRPFRRRLSVSRDLCSSVCMVAAGGGPGSDLSEESACGVVRLAALDDRAAPECRLPGPCPPVGWRRGAQLPVERRRRQPPV